MIQSVNVRLMTIKSICTQYFNTQTNSTIEAVSGYFTEAAVTSAQRVIQLCSLA